MNSIIIGLLLAVPFPVNAQAEEIVTPIVEEMTIPELIEHYSLKYNVDKEVISNVIKCESSFNPNAVNMADSHANSQGSWGIAQFSKETFAHFSKEAGIENGDPMNPQQAIETMAYMFSKGLAFHWSCFNKLNR